VSGFRLLLQQHTPIVLAAFAPQLDRLLQEASARLHQDWSRAHELPLVRDEVHGIYHASQLIFGITARQGLEARELGLPASVSRLSLEEASDPPRRVKQDGAPTSPRLTRHRAYLAPYLIFYGEGDGQACAQLLELLDGVGREYARHCGAFTVLDVRPDDSGKWALRPWPCAAEGQALPFEPVRDRLSLAPGAEPTQALRPPRLLRERVA
jgi:hypothetical protein